MRVLLADDSILMLDRLNEMLAPCNGVELIGECRNGTQTLNAILALEPDMVIIDISMPGLNGLEVIEAAKLAKSRTFFVVLTMYASQHYRELAMLLGSDYFLSKVDDFEDIPRVVQEMIIKMKITS